MKKLLTLFFVLLTTLVYAQVTNNYKYLELKNVDTTTFTQRVGQFWYNPTVGKFTFHDASGYKHFGTTSNGLGTVWNSSTSSVDLVFSGASITLKSSSPFDLERDGAVMFQLGNFVYVVGGWNPADSPITNSEVYRANISDLTTWTKITDAPWFRRHSMGVGVLTIASVPTAFIWGADFYSGSSANDVWKATADGAGVLTWTQTQATLPYTHRILFGYTVHKGYLYTIGGQDADGGTPRTDIWRSSDGITWTSVATGLTQFGININGCVASFNGKLYVNSGGYYQTSARTYLKNTWVSSDDGVTWTAGNPTMFAVQYPASVVYNNKIVMVTGGTPNNPNGEKAIQYMDASGSWHQSYETTLDIHAEAVALLSNNTIGIGGGTSTTTGAPTNKFYTVSDGSLKNTVYGDNTRFNMALIDSILTAMNVNALTTTTSLVLNNQLTLNYALGTWPSIGFGASTITGGGWPAAKFDFLGATILAGVTEGAGGGNGFENTTRTTNSNKILRFNSPTYAAVSSTQFGLLGSYSTASGNRVYVGGSSGIGQTVATSVHIAAPLVVGSSSSITAGSVALDLLTTTTDILLTRTTADANIVSPLNGMMHYNTTSNKFKGYENGAWVNVVGGGGTPGGSDTQVQFNNAGSFAGNSNLTINNGTGVVTFGQLPTIPLTPVATTDAVSKSYVDGLLLGPFSTSANGYTLSSGAAGSVLKGDNTWLSIGANGTVLTSNGTTFSWVAGGGGGNPFSDATAILKNNADATKLLRFDLSGFTTGTTRILTPPNFDGTVATLAGTETFTNKTLTAPKFANLGYIADGNGNAQITFNTTASAVNNVGIYNTATGVAPLIASVGTDTNVGLTIGTKGTGALSMYGNLVTIGAQAVASGSVGPISITGNNSSGSGQAGSDIIIKTGQGVTGNANSGSIYLDADVKAGTGKVGSVSFFKTTADFGGGEKVIYMGNATTNPTTNPTGGGLMFVKSADNKPYWRTPAGVETVMLGGAGGNPALSSITAATGTNTIDNLNFAQEWQASTLAGASFLKLSSTSTLAASNLQKLFELSLSGANATSTQTTWAGYVANTHTGTASTNVGLYVEASGGTTNTALDVKGNIDMKGANNELRTYSSYTDASNFSVVNIGLSDYWGVVGMGMDGKTSGTRVGGNFLIYSSGSSGSIGFAAGATSQWSLNNGGHFYPRSNNAYDLGGDVGGNIVRNFYTTQAHVGGNAAPTSTVQLDGSFAPTITSTSTDLTLTIAHYTVKVDASGANRTITLPASSGISGRVYIIKKTDSSANTVTIDGNASETLDGATTKVINTQWAGYVIQSDNTNWVIISTF